MRNWMELAWMELASIEVGRIASQVRFFCQAFRR
jgi:hypothetical protein